MTEAKFLKQIEGTQFEVDMDDDLSVNGNPMPRGVWNLILSVRDVSLFTKGIKAHKNWRLKDVKWYFGVTGGKVKVLEQLRAYKDLLVPAKIN
jgi:hypothetical protein